jgi:hypothetical protein
MTMHIGTELVFCQSVAKEAIAAAIFTNLQLKKASRYSPSFIICMGVLA